MTELTEASLIQALKEIQKMLVDEPITLKPTKLLIRPADLAELGLTVDDVVNMIKENNERKETRRTPERVLFDQANPKPAHQAAATWRTEVDT